MQTLSAYDPAAIVIRSPHAGAAQLVAGWTPASVINAGDGKHEHPTQALLDVYTLRRRLGALDGANIWIVGDVMHSRVARSNILALQRMGASVTVCGPPTLIPREIEALGCAATPTLERLAEADVVYVLRMQHERMHESFVPSLREYAVRYQINTARLRPGQLLMHPGPGEPRRRALGGRDRLPAGADRRAGQGRCRGEDGGPLRAARACSDAGGGSMSASTPPTDRLFCSEQPARGSPDPQCPGARPAQRDRRAARHPDPRRADRRARRAQLDPCPCRRRRDDRRGRHARVSRVRRPARSPADPRARSTRKTSTQGPPRPRPGASAR